MKHPSLIRNPAFVFALTTLFILAPAAVRAQSDDFNDGNDAGWTRQDLRLAGTPSTYTFPSDGSGGSAYRFFSPAPAVSTFGPARTLSYRPDGAHTNFKVAVDLLRWDNNLDQGFGTFARAGNIGLGSSVGYFFNYNPHQFPNLPGTAGELQINRVTREVPLTIARAVINLDPARKYRLLATGFGSYLVAKIHDLADPTRRSQEFSEFSPCEAELVHQIGQKLLECGYPPGATGSARTPQSGSLGGPPDQREDFSPRMYAAVRCEAVCSR